MSDKSYKYIGKGCYSGVIVLFYGSEFGSVIDSGSNGHKSGDIRDDWHEPNFENITREYLANTYGKCESQEHADFICKLAESAGFDYINDYNEKAQWFSFGREVVDFHKESTAKSDGEKLIHLPLPPKEDEMPETKPIYTKEMHERGELPPVGSYFVMNDVPSCFSHSRFNGLPCKVLALTDHDDGVVVTFDNEKEGFGALRHHKGMESIPTIEDELAEFIYSNNRKRLFRSDGVDLAKDLLNKYNITPK